jgi:hypothetical protein
MKTSHGLQICKKLTEKKKKYLSTRFDQILVIFVTYHS